jgi:hypothetical protein
MYVSLNFPTQCYNLMLSGFSMQLLVRLQQDDVDVEYNLGVLLFRGLLLWFFLCDKNRR